MVDPQITMLRARWVKVKKRVPGVGWEEFVEGSRVNRSFLELYYSWVKGGRARGSVPCILKTFGSPREWVWIRLEGLRSIAGCNGRGGLKGVVKINSKEKPFAAYIRQEGRKVFLGAFATAEAAARCYDKHAKHVHGPLAPLNFPE